MSSELGRWVRCLGRAESRRVTSAGHNGNRYRWEPREESSGKQLSGALPTPSWAGGVQSPPDSFQHRALRSFVAVVTSASRPVQRRLAIVGTWFASAAGKPVNYDSAATPVRTGWARDTRSTPSWPQPRSRAAYRSPRRRRWREVSMRWPRHGRSLPSGSAICYASNRARRAIRTNWRPGTCLATLFSSRARFVVGNNPGVRHPLEVLSTQQCFAAD